jgi:hypothetical protein
MLRRVALVRTDVSEDFSACILGITIAVTSNRRMLRCLVTRATRRHITEDDILHTHRRENPKS